MQSVEHVFYVGEGIALVAIGYLVYLAVTHGVPYAWATLKGWWTSTSSAVSTLESKLSADISALRADVAAIKTKLGMDAPAAVSPAAAPAAPPAPSAS